MTLRERTDKIAAILLPGGPMSLFLPDYEHRQSQIEMAGYVMRAFIQDEIALLEAGTGVGKSMAYLLPAISWALEHDERVVISTNTINLQEQLLEKDIPLIQQALGWDFAAVVVKGWSNYLCRLKAGELLLQTQLFSDDEATQKEKLQKWVQDTDSGSKSDLSFYVSEALWQEFACDADDCWRKDCPFYGDCFFFMHRRAAAAAQLLITNHHLLCADLAIKQEVADAGILPSYQRVIIDEAHNLEDVACEYLGNSLSSLGTKQLLGRLYRRKDGNEQGLLSAVRKTALSEGIDDLANAVESRLLPAYRDLEEISLRFFAQLGALTPKDNEGYGIRLCGDGRGLWEQWRKVSVPALEQLSVAARDMGNRLIETAEYIQDDERCTSIHHSLNSLGKRCTNLGHTGDFFATYPHDNFVAWIERKGATGTNLTLNSAPINVGSFFHEQLFARTSTVVLTSATLTVNGDFSFLCDRLGIGEGADSLLLERRFTSQLASPFFYKEQVLLGIPADFPSPQAGSYDQALLKLLIELLPVTKGRTFVLFTSYAAMKRQARLLKEHLQGFVILVQGQGERKQLIEEFRTTSNAVLLGTDSFWEGVDVPGEDLSCVVIAKLPFRPVKDPITEAKCEDIRKRGGNDFLEYMLPLAVLKTRQGFGRLIRKTTDMGVVLICDVRILTRRYGAVVLGSMPDCTLVKGSVQEILAACTGFIS
ncbi:MAG: helicase C-terminal domain-containing protein [Limnochordia bacterium]|nr:helicase C-terminal domain-containing protein [Limnochordia bacterium]